MRSITSLSSMRAVRTVRRTTVALAFAVTATGALAQGSPPSAPGIGPAAPMRTIIVTGTGEANAKPDQAIATFTVLRTAKTARAALDAANDGMAKVIEGMKQLGIESRDLQTSGFSIAPQYRYDNGPDDGTREPPEIVAYEVRNSLTVRTREIASIGKVLDTAVTLGVNQGGDIRFDLADPQKPMDEARRKAVDDATAAARLLAEAAGVSLGEVREIEVDAGGQPPVPLGRSMKMMAAEAAPSVPVETGESSFTARVRMVFSIAP